MPTLTLCRNWAIWDLDVYLIQETPDPERGIFAQGFPTREAAVAAWPALQERLQALGIELTLHDILFLPAKLGGIASLDMLGIVPAEEAP